MFISSHTWVFLCLFTLPCIFLVEVHQWNSSIYILGYEFKSINLTGQVSVLPVGELVLHVKRHICIQVLMMALNRYPLISVRVNIFHTTETSADCRRIWCHSHYLPKMDFMGCISTSFPQHLFSSHWWNCIHYQGNRKHKKSRIQQSAVCISLTPNELERIDYRCIRQKMLESLLLLIIILAKNIVYCSWD